MLRAGCGRFPVSHAAYFAALDALEAGGPGGRLPGPETAERWRREAPRDFVFSVPCAPAVALGGFKATEAVRSAWERTARVAEALAARFILLETPASFHPSADHLRDFYAFVRGLPRGERVLAWQPAGAWDEGLLRRVCSDLRLVHAVDPLARLPVAGAVNYFRLRGGGQGRKPSRGHRYSDPELREIARLGREKPTCAFFLTADMWPDARRLARLCADGLPPRRRG